MLKLFVISIRVAIPLMLAIAILIAARAYAPMERRTLARITWPLTIASLAGGFAIAMLRLNTDLIDVPTFNMWVGPPTYLAMLVFLVAVWLFGARDLHDIVQTWRHRLLTVTALVALVLTTVLFSFPYFFATDGIVLMGSSAFDTQSMLRLAGFVLGTLLVLVVSWGYVVSAARVPWWVRSAITTVVFAAMALPRFILVYQQLTTRRFVPKLSFVFDIVLFIQGHTAVTNLVLAVLMSVPGLLALWALPRAVSASAPAQRIRKAEAISRRKFLGLSVVGSALFCWALTDGQRRAEYVPELSDIEASSVEGESVYVSHELVNDGHLHRFGYASKEGPEVRFIVIKKNDVAFGTGLDACQICGNAGYYEEKGKVICRKCGVMMNIQTIGFDGGCNPIPIAYELAGDRLKFSVDELESHAKIFA